MKLIFATSKIKELYMQHWIPASTMHLQIDMFTVSTSISLLHTTVALPCALKIQFQQSLANQAAQFGQFLGLLGNALAPHLGAWVRRWSCSYMNEYSSIISLHVPRKAQLSIGWYMYKSQCSDLMEFGGQSCRWTINTAITAHNQADLTQQQERSVSLHLRC